MQFSKFTAAAVIASPVFLDLQATMGKVVSLIDEAADQGAKLIAFPETFIPAYPWWIWMAINNNKRLELYKRLFKNAVALDEAPIQEVCRKAAARGVTVVLGINERDGMTLYNTQVYIDSEGQIMGRHRKLVPTGEERTVWGMGDGSDLRVFETELGKIGGLVCYEHSMSLSRYALYAMGEQIHVANWPGADFRSQPRDRNRVIDAAARFTAFEGQVFVLNSCSCLSQEEVDFYMELDPANRDILAPGGGIAGIVAPNGEYMVDPITGKEGIVYAEIDMEQILDSKHMVDSVGHYARWDVTRLQINTEANRPFGNFPPSCAGNFPDQAKIKPLVAELDEMLAGGEDPSINEKWNQLKAVITPTN